MWGARRGDTSSHRTVDFHHLSPGQTLSSQAHELVALSDPRILQLDSSAGRSLLAAPRSRFVRR